MKQKHMLDFTTLQILFSDVKCVLAAESVVRRRMWLFHACTEILIHLPGPAGSAFPGDSHLPVLLLPVPALSLLWLRQAEVAAVGIGMWCLGTCSPLPALYIRITVLLRWCRPCALQNRTPRLSPQHLLLPSLFLLFCFSRIPICRWSPLPLKSIWDQQCVEASR